MAFYRVTTEELERTWEEYRSHGCNQMATAEAMGIARSTLQHRLGLMAEQGIGSMVKPRPGMKFGRSTRLHNLETGQDKLIWLRESPDLSPEDVIAAIKEGVADIKRDCPILDVRQSRDDVGEFVNLYAIADLHLGMYSWKPETGNDYDVEIASNLLRKHAMDVMMRSDPAKEAIILNLGDFMHSDTNENRTLRSNNALDSDTRYTNTLRIGTGLLIYAAELAAQKHEHVTIVNIPGNHDQYGTIALREGLIQHYIAHPRITVDASPSPFWFKRFGNVLLGAAHGDMAKPHHMVNVMAAKRAVEWGQSEHRYVYLGHIHRKTSGATVELGGEIGGAIWETFQTLAPRDAWGNTMGFTAGRSLEAITFHKRRGIWSRQYSTVEGGQA